MFFLFSGTTIPLADFFNVYLISFFFFFLLAAVKVKKDSGKKKKATDYK
jgi:hypothetical protein